MKRVVVALAVGVPIGSFALAGVVYWLAFAETARALVVALRAPTSEVRA